MSDTQYFGLIPGDVRQNEYRYDGVCAPGQSVWSFNYTIGFVDVYVAGDKIPTSAFTATDGSTITIPGVSSGATIAFVSHRQVPLTSYPPNAVLPNITLIGTTQLGNNSTDSLTIKPAIISYTATQTRHDGHHWFQQPLVLAGNGWHADDSGVSRMYLGLSDGPVYLRSSGASGNDLLRLRRGTDEQDVYGFAASGSAYFYQGLGIGTARAAYSDLTVSGATSSIAVGAAPGGNGGYLALYANANIGYMFSNHYYNGADKASIGGYSNGIELHTDINETRFWRSPYTAANATITYVLNAKFDSTGVFIVGQQSGAGTVGLNPGDGANTGYLSLMNAAGSRIGFMGHADTTGIYLSSDTGLPYIFYGGAAPRSDTAATTSTELVRYGEMSTALGNKLSNAVGSWNLDSGGNQRLYFTAVSGVNGATTVAGYGDTSLVVHNSTLGTDVATFYGAGNVLIPTGPLRVGTTGHVRLDPGNSTNTGYVSFYNNVGARIGFMGYGDGSLISLNSDTGVPYKFTGGVAPKSDTVASTSLDLVRFDQYTTALAAKLNNAVGAWNNDSAGNNRAFFQAVSGANGTTFLGGYGTTTLIVQNISLGTNVLTLAGDGVLTTRNNVSVGDGTVQKVALNKGSTGTGYVEFNNTSGTRLGYIGNSTSSYHSIATDSASIPFKFIGGAAPQSDTDAVGSTDLVRMGQISALLSSRPGHTYTNTDWTWLDKNRGLILQWGFLPGPYDPVTDIGPFSFPVAFTSSCFILVPGTNINGGGGGYSQPYAQNVTTSQFSFHIDQWNGTQGYQIYWFAIGV